MNKNLSLLSGAMFAAAMCLVSPSAMAQEVISRSTTTVSPAPAITEQHRSTTTNTTVVEKPGLSDEAKDRIEERMENRNELRKEVGEARAERREEVSNEVDDALDD